MPEEGVGGDFEFVKKAGDGIREIGHIFESIASEIRADAMGKFEGDDEISEALKKNYVPTEEAVLSFLGDGREAVETFGGKTVDVSKIFDDVDDTATDSANAGGNAGKK